MTDDNGAGAGFEPPLWEQLAEQSAQLHQGVRLQKVLAATPLSQAEDSTTFPDERDDNPPWNLRVRRAPLEAELRPQAKETFLLQELLKLVV